MYPATNVRIDIREKIMSGKRSGVALNSVATWSNRQGLSARCCDQLAATRAWRSGVQAADIGKDIEEAGLNGVAGCGESMVG